MDLPINLPSEIEGLPSGGLEYKKPALRRDQYNGHIERQITGHAASDAAAAKFRPLGDLVLVRVLNRDAQEKKATLPNGGESLIIVPATAKKDPRTFVRIVALGPKAKALLDQLDVHVGDECVIDFGAGSLVNIDGGEHLVMKAHNIAAKVER